MAAWQLALLAYEGLKLLFELSAAATTVASTAMPAEGARICYQELVSPSGGYTELVVSRAAMCPDYFSSFTMPAADDHLMVRR